MYFVYYSLFCIRCLSISFYLFYVKPFCCAPLWLLLLFPCFCWKYYFLSFLFYGFVSVIVKRPFICFSNILWKVNVMGSIQTQHQTNEIKKKEKGRAARFANSKAEQTSPAVFLSSKGGNCFFPERVPREKIVWEKYFSRNRAAENRNFNYQILRIRNEINNYGKIIRLRKKLAIK